MASSSSAWPTCRRTSSGRTSVSRLASHSTRRRSSCASSTSTAPTYSSSTRPASSRRSAARPPTRRATPPPPALRRRRRRDRWSSLFVLRCARPSTSSCVSRRPTTGTSPPRGVLSWRRTRLSSARCSSRPSSTPSSRSSAAQTSWSSSSRPHRCAARTLRCSVARSSRRCPPAASAAPSSTSSRPTTSTETRCASERVPTWST
mmetsp:Transcript_6639/g.15618  ORF Transcript_6639/g.15618 Transcript_6639/m.15618 type:complete len:204 (-) Transcript_6639:33-644(-)